MSDKPQRRYEIILGFPGEPRVSDYRPTEFAAAVEYALAFSRKSKGVRVQVNLAVPKSPIHVHGYMLFVCEFPVIEPFMQKSIEDYFGSGPYYRE